MDSNYFQKIFLKQEQSISKAKSKTLAELDCDLKSFGAYSLNNHVEYLDDGVPFIRGINLKKGRITFNDVIYISNEAHKLLWKSEVRPKTILLSMSGTIGDVAIASESLKYPINSNQDIAKIYCSEQLNPYYLYTFLSSYFGQNYLIREARGSVQQHVFLSQIEKFQIPEFSTIFDKAIESLVKNADLSDSHSKQCYEKSENLLLETLGMANFSPSAEKVNIKSFKDSFAATSRIDAEYYQQKYEEVENKLQQYGYDTFDSFIDNYSTGYPYSSDSYLDEGLPLIRINNIKDGSLDVSDCAFIPLTDIALSPKDLANSGDILISMSGSIGNSCKIPEGIKAVVNQRIMRITTKDFHVDVLPLIINSIVGKSQLERIGTGGVQTNISATDIKQILIPKIEAETQIKIATLVQQSFALKAQSERLLDAAKQAVEIAIETNEDAALAWLASIH